MSDETDVISFCESARKNLVDALTNSPNSEMQQQIKNIPSVEKILQKVRLGDGNDDKKYFISSVVEGYVGDLNIDQKEKQTLTEQLNLNKSQE